MPRRVAAKVRTPEVAAGWASVDGLLRGGPAAEALRVGGGHDVGVVEHFGAAGFQDNRVGVGEVGDLIGGQQDGPQLRGGDVGTRRPPNRLSACCKPYGQIATLEGATPRDRWSPRVYGLDCAVTVRRARQRTLRCRIARVFADVQLRTVPKALGEPC